ncbi:MAG TPA: sugar ABC transporter substrate-binding protein [Actinomycetota bacterium]|nr:sugar ABC transporter substrate-binding protein [Actinomycetota bacterium]
MKHLVRWFVVIASLALVAASCTGDDGGDGGTTAPGESPEPVTITVVDYYGEATPLSEEVIAAFEAEYPWITVKYEAGDWDSMREKFTVRVTSGDSPDVATMDMTWIPTFASKGIFADLSELSGGQLNDAPITDQYSDGALEAMTFEDHYVTMMFDFDAYALYYRADQFDAKGIDVPTNWDELSAAAEKLAEDTDGDGENDKYMFEVYGNDCFHWCQFLFQAGGSILTDDNTAAAFDSEAGLSAMEYYRSFLDNGSGVFWGEAEGEPIRGIKDERIGMFLDGPYYMGLLKDGAPDQSGKWAVAPAPYSVEPGSYLGGTGLSIPVNAPHPEEAWLFVQYMLRPEQQLGVFTLAGAAPATEAALASPELTQPDEYFGGQAPFPIFADTMAIATHFPYVEQWDPIDTTIGTMVESVMLGESDPQAALTDGAAKVNEELAG